MRGALGSGQAVVLCRLEHVLIDTDAVVVAECSLVLRVWVALCVFFVRIGDREKFRESVLACFLGPPELN